MSNGWFKPNDLFFGGLPVGRCFFDGSLPVQTRGPGAVQFVGIGLPEEGTTTMGDGKLSTEVAISLNETGT